MCLLLQRRLGIWAYSLIVLASVIFWFASLSDCSRAAFQYHGLPTTEVRRCCCCCVMEQGLVANYLASTSTSRAVGHCLACNYNAAPSEVLQWQQEASPPRTALRESSGSCCNTVDTVNTAPLWCACCMHARRSCGASSLSLEHILQ
jgi:hypothetical protein